MTYTNKTEIKRSRGSEKIRGIIPLTNSLTAFKSCVSCYKPPPFFKRPTYKPQENPNLNTRQIRLYSNLQGLCMQRGYTTITTDWLLNRYPEICPSRKTLENDLSVLDKNKAIGRLNALYNGKCSRRYIFTAGTYQFFITRLLDKGTHQCHEISRLIKHHFEQPSELKLSTNTNCGLLSIQSTFTKPIIPLQAARQLFHNADRNGNPIIPVNSMGYKNSDRPKRSEESNHRGNEDSADHIKICEQSYDYEIFQDELIDYESTNLDFRPKSLDLTPYLRPKGYKLEVHSSACLQSSMYTNIPGLWEWLEVNPIPIQDFDLILEFYSIDPIYLLLKKQPLLYIIKGLQDNWLRNELNRRKGRYFAEKKFMQTEGGTDVDF